MLKCEVKLIYNIGSTHGVKHRLLFYDFCAFIVYSMVADKEESKRRIRFHMGLNQVEIMDNRSSLLDFSHLLPWLIIKITLYVTNNSSQVLCVLNLF